MLKAIVFYLVLDYNNDSGTEIPLRIGAEKMRFTDYKKLIAFIQKNNMILTESEKLMLYYLEHGMIKELIFKA